MKISQAVFLLLASGALTLSAAPAQAQAGNDKGTCYVQLFDGDNYRDDNIVLKGPGEYPDLKSLPGANKDWDDEADSFQSGKNTVVTFYPKPNFEGKAVTYRNGARKPRMDEPRSMKISCSK